MQNYKNKMKKIDITRIILWFFLAIPYTLAPIPCLYADFNYLGTGARPVSLGNCYTAFSDDVYGIYYNPGGISFTKGPELSTEFSQLWLNLSDGSSLSDGYLGWIYPKGGQAYGFAVQKFSLTGYYNENTVTLAYSKKLTDDVGLGVDLKQLQQNYVMDEYTRVDDVFGYGTVTNKSAIGIDPGVLWHFYPDYFMGISIINLNQPDVGLSEKESLPITLNCALAYRCDYPSNNLNLSIGMTQAESDYKILSGVEKWFLNGSIAVRAGYGFGTKQYSDISFGAGFSFRQAQVDYSINLPMGGMKETNGTHRISLTYKFVKVSEEEIAAQKNYKEEKARLTKTYEDQLKQNENKIAELETKLKEAQRAGLKEQPLQDEHARSLERQLLELQEKIKTQKKQQKISTPALERPAESATIEEAIPAEIPPAAAPAAASAAKKELSIRTHTVKEGESLPAIAQRYYNDSSQWKKIYEANRSKIERGQVVPGQVLVIP